MDHYIKKWIIQVEIKRKQIGHITQKQKEKHKLLKKKSVQIKRNGGLTFVQFQCQPLNQKIKIAQIKRNGGGDLSKEKART